MTNLVSIEGEREKRKEICVYCGKDAHTTPLACSRIAAVEIDPEFGITRVEFYDDVAGTDPGV
jgi:thymidine kinase